LLKPAFPLITGINVEGATITLNRGFPAATALGIIKAANISSNDYLIIAGNPIKIRLSTANCEVSYLSATALSAPVISFSIAAC